MEKAMVVFFTLVACAGDIQRGRISNGLILWGLTAGLCGQMAEYGAMGLIFFFEGALLPILLLGPLFYFRMLGAGDIKLLCTLGGYAGPQVSLWYVVASIFAGGILAGILIIRRRNFRSRMGVFWSYWKRLATERTWRAYDKGEKQGGTFHFSIPILISVLLWAGGM